MRKLYSFFFKQTYKNKWSFTCVCRFYFVGLLYNKLNKYKMIKDTQEYLQHWEKENNPFYPSEMRWDRLQVNRFLKDYKKQLTLTDVSGSYSEKQVDEAYDKGFKDAMVKYRK